MKLFHGKLLSIILISCLGIIVYSNSLHCSFHFDDEPNLTQNAAIKNIGHMQNIWNYYHTRFLVFLSLAFNYHFGGLDTFGYHVFNVAVHLMAAILVWWLLWLTLSTPAMRGDGIARHAGVISLFAGLIFVSHPLQTEAVTYIWERAASMVALLYLASLCFYIKSRLLQIDKSNYSHERVFYMAALMTTVMAMFTKENSITLPLMILSYEFTFLKNKDAIDWKRMAPFLLTIFIMPVTLLLSKSETFQDYHGILRIPGGVITSIHYFITQFRVMLTYVRLIFIPIHQNLDYDYPLSRHIYDLPVLTGIFFLTVVGYWVVRLYSKFRLISFSIFWFFLTLTIPESSFWAMGDLILEHRLYLPLAGYSIFLVTAAYYLLGRHSIKMMVMMLTILIAFNSVLTYQRNKVWKNDLTLWNDAVQGSPHKARPHNNRGVAYFKEGRIDQAMVDYNTAIAVDPEFDQAYNNRGSLETRQGDFKKSITDISRAIKLNPRNSKAYYNLALNDLQEGADTDAILNFTKAIELDPDAEEVYVNRGLLFLKSGNLQQALFDLTMAVELNPSDAEAYSDRGSAYGEAKDFPRAIADFSKAIETNSGYAQAYYNRGGTYYQQGEYAKAWVDVHRAQQLGYPVSQGLIDVLKKSLGQER